MLIYMEITNKHLQLICKTHKENKTEKVTSIEDTSAVERNWSHGKGEVCRTGWNKMSGNPDDSGKDAQRCQ